MNKWVNLGLCPWLPAGKPRHGPPLERAVKATMFSGEISLRISLMTARRLAQNPPEGAGLVVFVLAPQRIGLLLL